MRFFVNFIPMNALLYLKYFTQLFHQIGLSEGKKPRIYYLDAPDYPNLGDQAIAVAIRAFSKKNFPEYEFVEILQKDLLLYSKWLKEHIKGDDLIFLTGGGNMGNRYRTYEATRRFVISHFKNNRIIVFPQSISYTEDFFGRLSKMKSKTIYSKNKELIICAREKYSYQEIQHLYNNNKVILCPDIVLSMDKRNNNFSRAGVGISLRDDLEKLLSEDDRRKIYEELKSIFPDESIVPITTMSEQKEFSENNRDIAVSKKIDEIGKCKLLITDRLHATIFAYLSNTPCIVFQNSNKKILGTMQWLQNAKSICLIDDINQIKDAIHTVLECKNNTDIEFNYLSIRLNV